VFDYAWENIPRQYVRVIFSHAAVTIRVDMTDPSSPSTDPVQPPAALVSALHRVLRPLVRLMVARGVTYPYLAEMLKGLFVEVAERDFGIEGKPTTDSRVSLLSGVHRKDVSRLRSQTVKSEWPASPVVNLSSQVFARWLGDPGWRNRRGRPLPLPRLASEGGDRSFESLVAGISSDIRPRVLLDEWLRRGLVTLDEQDRVCLQPQAFTAGRGDEDKLHYFARQLHDHAAAASHNLQGGVPFLDRSLHADGLSAESVAELHELARDQGMQLLVSLNEAAQAAEARDQALPEGAPRRRFTLGVYFYESDQDRP
jgi:hypothetical protein